MNTSAKIGGLLAAVMLAASGSAMAAEPVNPYVTSSDGKVVMDPFGLCWRTGFWTPALAEALGYRSEDELHSGDLIFVGSVHSFGDTARKISTSVMEELHFHDYSPVPRGFSMTWCRTPWQRKGMPSGFHWRNSKKCRF